MKVPNDLRPEGRRIWRAIVADYDVRGNEPVLHELCRTADRLAEIRDRMRTAKDTTEFLRLANAESKTAGTFARCWRLLGLQQADIPVRNEHA